MRNLWLKFIELAVHSRTLNKCRFNLISRSSSSLVAGTRSCDGSTKLSLQVDQWMLRTVFCCSWGCFRIALVRVAFFIIIISCWGWDTGGTGRSVKAIIVKLSSLARYTNSFSHNSKTGSSAWVIITLVKSGCGSNTWTTFFKKAVHSADALCAFAIN